jgi:hypothetical protein
MLGRRRQADTGWHWARKGSVCLDARKLQVDKPRLRRKGRGAGKEVAIPAYGATQDRERMGARMLQTGGCAGSPRGSTISRSRSCAWVSHRLFASAKITSSNGCSHRRSALAA